MRNIINDLTQINFNKGRTQQIQYIVIHYTGNDGDTARGNANYFRTVNRNSSAHYFVDEKETVRVVKDEDTAWHCGTSGKYLHTSCRNTNAIGIEMCSRKDSKGVYYFKQEVVDATVELTQYLMKQYNIPIGNVVRHKDVTGKQCPQPYTVDSDWNNFKKLITNTSTSETYRVRKIWADTDSQKGAFSDLNNAKKCADENIGFSVFNSKGESLYTSQSIKNNEIDEIIDKMIAKGIISDKTHWKNVLEGKQSANPEFLAIVFERYNEAINKTKSKEEKLVNVAIGLSVVNSPDYWINVLQGKTIASPEYIKLLLESYHNKLNN